MIKPREAVKKTIKMWEWLRDNPSGTPSEYLFRNPKLDIFPNKNRTCFLCLVWCDECGQQRRHGSDCPLDTKNLHCDYLNGESPWREWVEIKLYAGYYDSGGKTADFHAQRIINACKRWLKRNENK